MKIPQARRWGNPMAPIIVGLCLMAGAGNVASAADAYLPIVMPITGFLSVEGGSQRNGAVMALEQAPGGMKVDFPVFDTGTSATGAATALDKALSSQKAIAAAVTVFGTEMVAMMPIAAEYKVPLLTISGLAKITESGNPYIFRFLPNDREIKVATNNNIDLKIVLAAGIVGFTVLEVGTSAATPVWGTLSLFGINHFIEMHPAHSKAGRAAAPAIVAAR